MNADDGVEASEAFTLAMQHYSNGRRAQAAQMYRAILQRIPDHSQALHMLGVIALQDGNLAAAISLIRQAIAGDGNNAGYWSNLGHAHRLAGQLPEAVTAGEQAVKLQPDLAGAHNNLGLALGHQGHLQRAVVCFQEALRRQPHYPAAYNNLGNALHGLGRLEEAINAFQQALRLRPDNAEACNNLAITHQTRGDLRAAMTWFQRALQIQPDYPEAHNNIGTIFLRLRNLDEAGSHFRKAIQFRPDYADASYNLGAVHQEQGNLDEAKALFRQTLQLRPTFVEASCNLATILTDQGLHEPAVAQWRETLRLHPDHSMAFYHLGLFANDGHYSFEPEELDRLHRLAASDQVTDANRSHYCFTLASRLDRQGSYDEAFRYYRQANDIRKRLLKEQNQAFDAEVYRTRVDHIIGTFDPHYFQTRAGWGIDTEVPVFVIGTPRSGTTLVEQILSSHPQVAGVGELEELQRLLAALSKNAQDTDINLHLPRSVNQTGARNLATAYLNKIHQRASGAARVVDKTLDNSSRLGWISLLFPRARVIYCRRDPRDACMSCYMQNFRNMPFAWSLEDLGNFYRHFDHLMSHWRQVLPIPMLEIQYEDLVAEPETVIRNLVAFCGLEWDQRCLSFYDNPRAVRTASKLQVRNPLSARAVGRWKNYAAHLGKLTKALGIVDDATPTRSVREDEAS